MNEKTNKKTIAVTDIISTADRDQGDLSTLIESIRTLGLLQPILLRPVLGGKYEVVDGRRRFAAWNALGWKVLPESAYTLAPENGEAAAMAHAANVVRKDLTPAEEVRQLAALADTHSVERLAEMFGRTPGWIRRRIQIETLSDTWLSVLDDPETAAQWNLEKLALIARQPKTVQDQMEWMACRECVYSMKEIQYQIDRFNRTLSAAIFDKCGCAHCGSNSATSLLFDDLAEDAVCLNPKCWTRKTLGKVEDIVRREKLTPIRGGGEVYGAEDTKYAEKIKAKHSYDFGTVRDPKPGETANAIIVSGTQIGRRVVAVKRAESSGQGGKAPEVKKERTVKEMVEELARKREKRALVLLLEYLRKEYSAAAWMAKIPKEEELGDLFMVLRLYGMSGDKRNEYGCSLEPEDIQETGIEEVRQHAYFQALEQIKRSLDVETAKTMTAMSQVARAGIAKLLRIEDKAKDFHDQAMIEIKEPKSLTEARAREKAAKAARKK